MNSNQIPPCAGVIVIDLDNQETILVCTDHDNYSFPKGKRNKGESILDNALRELNEETGLTINDIQLAGNLTFDENSDRGGLATRYYVASLIKSKKEVTFDSSELKKVEWIKIEDVYKLEKFKERRKEILKKVMELFMFI